MTNVIIFIRAFDKGGGICIEIALSSYVKETFI